MKIRIHPLFILVMAISLVAGLFTQIFLLFTIVVLHELAHVWAARTIGYRVKEIELLPFGGVARLEHGTFGWNPRHETLIAIAGPVCNFLLVALTIVIGVFFRLPEAWKDFFVVGNLTIAFFNLLPALPLDGGRILRAALSQIHGFRKATKVGVYMAMTLSVALVMFGVMSLWLGYGQVGISALGVFLFVSAFQLQKQLQYDTIRFLDTKRRKSIREPLPVRTLMATPEMMLLDVVGQFSPDCYHLVVVVEEGSGYTHTLTEDLLLEEVFNGAGVRVPLSKLIHVA